MSKGDNLFGIKTTYKGINMRSKLETKVCMFLDALNIKWNYEPKLFLLSNGISYIPDLYLPEHNMWIEIKGLIKNHNKEISKLFVKENHTELLMISANENYWVSSIDFSEGIGTDKNIQIGKCSKCHNYFFCSVLGSWHCRKCGWGDGDHDIFATINSFGKGDIDFSDVKSIQRWLSVNKTSV